MGAHSVRNAPKGGKALVLPSGNPNGIEVGRGFASLEIPNAKARRQKDAKVGGEAHQNLNKVPNLVKVVSGKIASFLAMTDVDANLTGLKYLLGLSQNLLGLAFQPLTKRVTNPHSKLPTHHSPFTIHHSPFIIHHSSFIIHHYSLNFITFAVIFSL
jgi:hypothetical protein